MLHIQTLSKIEKLISEVRITVIYIYIYIFINIIFNFYTLPRAYTTDTIIVILTTYINNRYNKYRTQEVVSYILFSSSQSLSPPSSINN